MVQIAGKFGNRAYGFSSPEKKPTGRAERDPGLASPSKTSGAPNYVATPEKSARFQARAPAVVKQEPAVKSESAAQPPAPAAKQEPLAEQMSLGKGMNDPREYYTPREDERDAIAHWCSKNGSKDAPWVAGGYGEPPEDCAYPKHESTKSWWIKHRVYLQRRCELQTFSCSVVTAGLVLEQKDANASLAGYSPVKVKLERREVVQRFNVSNAAGPVTALPGVKIYKTFAAPGNELNIASAAMLDNKSRVMIAALGVKDGAQLAWVLDVSNVDCKDIVEVAAFRLSGGTTHGLNDSARLKDAMQRWVAAPPTTIPANAAPGAGAAAAARAAPGAGAAAAATQPPPVEQSSSTALVPIQKKVRRCLLRSSKSGCYADGGC